MQTISSILYRLNFFYLLKINTLFKSVFLFLNVTFNLTCLFSSIYGSNKLLFIIVIRFIFLSTNIYTLIYLFMYILIRLFIALNTSLNECSIIFICTFLKAINISDKYKCYMMIKNSRLFINNMIYLVVYLNIL